MIRKLRKGKKVFTVTFDQDRIIDTVECNGKLLSTKNADVKIILNNADSILYGAIPSGFEKA